MLASLKITVEMQSEDRVSEIALYNLIQPWVWKNRMQSCKRRPVSHESSILAFPFQKLSHRIKSTMGEEWHQWEMSTLAVSKSPGYNKRICWHKIFTTLLRQGERLYSFTDVLMSASLLGWVWYMAGLELIWVHETEGRGWHTFLFVLQVWVFFSFRVKVMWLEQHSFIHIQPSRAVLNSSWESQKK